MCRADQPTLHLPGGCPQAAHCVARTQEASGSTQTTNKARRYRSAESRGGGRESHQAGAFSRTSVDAQAVQHHTPHACCLLHHRRSTRDHTNVHTNSNVRHRRRPVRRRIRRQSRESRRRSIHQLTICTSGHWVLRRGLLGRAGIDQRRAKCTGFACHTSPYVQGTPMFKKARCV